jgi:hypothetical protein
MFPNVGQKLKAMSESNQQGISGEVRLNNLPAIPCSHDEVLPPRMLAY